MLRIPITCQYEDCRHQFYQEVDNHNIYAIYFHPDLKMRIDKRISRSKEDIKRSTVKSICPKCHNENIVYIMRKMSFEKLRKILPEGQCVKPGDMLLPDENGTSISKGTPVSQGPDFIEIEMEYRLDKIYSKVIDEINSCVDCEAFSSALVMTRKLVENLIVDILRFKYDPTKQHDMYFDNGTKHFLPLNKLIENFEKIWTEYRRYGLEKDHLTRMKRLRKTGNVSAHSIVDLVTKPKLMSLKGDTNHVVILLLRIIGIIRGILNEEGKLIKSKRK